MHIKRMHDMIEKLTRCAEMEFEKGIENVDAKEMGEVVDIIKDLAEAEYYAKISKAMDESEYGEDYDENGPMEERMYYRGQPRDSRGRYMSRRGRRDYEEPMMMDNRMDLDDYKAYMRDMDMPHKMYYTDGGSSGMSGGSSMGNTSTSGTRNYSQNTRDSREGRSGMMRRNYMETKETHKGNTPEDKQAKVKELDAYMKELSEDVTEMITDASQEEKNVLKSKMQALLQKI